MPESVEGLLRELTLDEKCSLTAGASLWYLPSVERVGLPALKVSDGPSGVRGDSYGGRRSLSLPCGTAVGSTWNPELVAQLGEALAGEARSKGVHVLLGPTVCIVRTPLAGRTFESFAEDPLLTARLTVAYVRGVQSQGVACCIKHYACNDQEHERMSISAEVDERTLREIHLVAFEAAVREAGVWALMTAYNKVHGIYCGEQPELLNGILRGEWGFDGVTMSDWYGTHSTAPAALAGLDLEMPGPPSWLGPNLAAAVRQGAVGEEVVDEQVRHLLGLMDRVGLFGTSDLAPVTEQEDDDPGRRALARQVAAEGTVLLRNDGLLPLDPASGNRVAVIGPNAVQMAMGGGSSEVTPYRRRSLVDALAERLPAATVTYEVGCRIDRGIPPMDLRLLTPTAGGTEGFTVEYFDQPELPAGDSGTPVNVGITHSPRAVWIGPPAGLETGQWSVRLKATFTPDVSGEWRLGLESAGRSVLRLDDEVVLDNSDPQRGTGFYGAGSEPIEVHNELEAGRAYALTIDLWPRSSSTPIMGSIVRAEHPEPEDEFGRAVEAAGAADVAVVVVGLNGQWESEGYDRPNLRLPGVQRELVEAVLDVNPRTVVVVNAGAPVEMPWAQRAGAVLLPWYAGEEGADAVADIVVGLSDPGGRLPVTMPARLEDTPTSGAAEWYPGVDGKVVYEEGVFVGYRHYDTNHIEPAFAFGYGLSYGDVVWEDVDITAEKVTVRLWNRGARPGTEVVQVYRGHVGSPPDRPPRELVGFVKVGLDPGQRQQVEVGLDAVAYRYWDVDTHEWRSDRGGYELLVGASSRDIRESAAVEWDGR
ncbi:MAG TPA: glycoside hydrolase family 3 C-terminal domain-containing protein [Acidimicrobiales bacterium]|nr:glycoside hydrolase family 3 C-terminal domain-containing protein [Acidimicrobiales bacterium]